jgi:hypothetical protein
LIQLQLSQNTLRTHVNNLWVLGGEIIRTLSHACEQCRVASLLHGIERRAFRLEATR